MRLKKDEYRCEDCGEIYKKSRDDSEAIKEAEENFGEYSKWE